MEEDPTFHRLKSMGARLFKPANAIAFLALCLALGGTAVAAGLITGAKIKNSSLTGADIRKSSLTGSDVKNKSLTKADFKGSIQGPQGPQGAQGATGPTGAAGPTNLPALKYVSSNLISSGVGTDTSGTAACPVGQNVIGGGVGTLGGGAAGLIVSESGPGDNASDAGTLPDNEWRVSIRNPAGGAAASYLVYAICTTTSGTS